MTTKPTDTHSSSPATEPLARRLSEGLGHDATDSAPPLWFDDGGRAWWGAHELRGEHLLAWREAAVAVAVASVRRVRSLDLREDVERLVRERDEQRAKLLPLLDLLQEVFSIAAHGCLLDGDAVNAPTLLWAEEWQRKISGPNAKLT